MGSGSSLLRRTGRQVKDQLVLGCDQNPAAVRQVEHVREKGDRQNRKIVQEVRVVFCEFTINETPGQAFWRLGVFETSVDAVTLTAD